MFYLKRDAPKLDSESQWVLDFLFANTLDILRTKGS